jgi:hypothetical protein
MAEKVKRISVTRIWGLGIYINPDPYRYVALQFWSVVDLSVSPVIT